ncbi:MAG: tetratricopeptide repeat protein [Salibacteraceae bacterium]
MKKAGFILALCLMFLAGMGQNEAAEKHFEKAERLAQSLKYQEALAEYNEAIFLNAEELKYYLRRAFVYSALESYEEAVKDYTKVLEADPSSPYIFVSRGSAYNKLKKYNLAIADFNSALAIDPKNQEAYNNRGWSKEYLGDHDGACADWKKSKKLGNAEAKIIMKNTHCK